MAHRVLDERTIFLQAVAMPSSEARSAFLDEACGDDPRLRREVEALLVAHEDSFGLLDAPDRASATADRPSTLEVPGAVVGPYRLMEQIGEGGMGVVYMAEQSRPVRRKVALKVIKPGMDTRQVLARFEVERQALELMDHPNIAKVLDAGATDSGRPYFVMELIRGLPITDFCDRERLSIRERLDLFVLVCRAVQHAHQKGVIHRDIKPSNVMIAVIDGVAVPKVIDFGVAKATGDPITDQTLLTGFTQVIGTPRYMSPEQAGLSGSDIDTRSDIYSLGVLLYELLTGSTPFDSETFRNAALGEIQRIIREDEPPTPSSRLSELGATVSTVSADRHTDSRRLSHAVRGELDWIVMKALEKDRARRYETANDFAADVMRHLNNQPVEACPPSRLYHIQKFARRNRSRIVALGLIAGLGMALAVAVGERANRRAETATAVTRALEEAERWKQLAKWPEAMASVNQAEALLGPVGGIVALRLRSRKLRDDLTMVLRLDEIRQQMSAVKDDHFDTGLGDRLYGEAFRAYGIDVESLEPDVVASKMPAGSVREELVAALDDWMRIRRERHKKDDTGWKRLLEAARAADPDPWRNRVREAWQRGDRKALSDLASSAPLDRLHSCGVLLLQANLDTDQAVAVLREATQRRPGDFWLNHTLGMRLIGMHPPRIDEAIGYFRTASALRPESPGAILNVGHAFGHAGRTDESIAAYEQAIRLKPDYAMAYSNLGGALIDAGRFDEAIVALRQAIRLMPGGSLAPKNLSMAYYRKIVAGFQSVYEYVNDHIVRLKNQRFFLQTLLDPRSPPVLRRYFVLNLLASSLLTATAHAQTGPGSIYYRYRAATDTAYKVSGGGTNNTQLGLPPSPNVHLSTSLATYPGGRQFFGGSEVMGLIPNTSINYGDILLYSEQGSVATQVTNFRGPQYLNAAAPRMRSSNDNRDSFLSFVVYDARIASYLLVRYNGPISDIFLPTFVPFVADDSRLVVLTSTKIEYEHYAWDPTGRLLTYNDFDANRKQLTHLYDVTTNTSTLVNNPAVSGVELTSPWCSPTELRFFSQATYKDGTRGSVSFYPTTGQFSWVIKEGGKGNSRINSFTSIAISPDGTTLAFGLLRYSGNQTIPSLVRIPANGGSYTTLVNFPAVTVSGNPIIGGTWK